MAIRLKEPWRSIAIAAGGLVLGIGCCSMWRQFTGRAVELRRFEIALGFDRAGGVERDEATVKLAEAPGTDSLVWALLQKVGEDKTGFEATNMRPVDVDTVAQVLEHMRKDSSPPVLWAATGWLDDERRGRFSYRIWRGAGYERGDGVTDPLRDLARESLVRALGVDCGYDKEKWRQVIRENAIKRWR